MNLLDRITVKSVIGIFTVPTFKGRSVSMLRRPSYALSFSRDCGVIKYTHNGIDTISDKHHAVLLPMGEDYTLLNLEGGDFPIINFTAAEPITDKFVSFEIGNPDTYLKAFDRMVELSANPKNRNKIISILYDIFYDLSRENDKRDPVLSKAIEFISKNIGDPNLSNLTIARRAHISEVYFRRLFKAHYGTTPKQYILNMRMTRAKDLLLDGGTSISTIAEVCGFSSVYHFSRSFKSFTGICATEYIKIHANQSKIQERFI